MGCQVNFEESSVLCITVNGHCKCYVNTLSKSGKRENEIKMQMTNYSCCKHILQVGICISVCLLLDYQVTISIKNSLVFCPRT